MTSSPNPAARGLNALPEPSAGDLFFDIEGDPFVGTGGLEYLLGVGWVEQDGWQLWLPVLLGPHGN